MTRARRWLLRAGQAALVVLVTWGLYRAVGLNLAALDPAELARWRPHGGLLLLSTALLLIVYLAHAFLWRRVAADLLDRAPAPADTVRVYFLSGLGRYVPGKVWQLAGFALLAQRAGLPPLGATAAALVGQFAFLATGALFVAVMLPAWAGPLPAVLGVLAIAVAGGLLTFLFGSRPGERLREWIAGRLGGRGQALLEVGGRVRGRNATLWAAGYGASWLLLGAAFTLFVTAFVPEALAAPRHLSGTVAAAYLGGYLAVFAPAGIGIREGVMGALLAQVVPVPAAFVISVASRLWFTAAELLPLLALPALRTRGRAGSTDALRAL